MRLLAVILALLSVAAMAACNEKTLDRQALLNPESCKECHLQQFNDWQSSMHAYAADDPIFIAMNKKGQRETNGALGSFCVNCHAPMAVLEGATTDGLNLDEVPRELKGVTCYFCHQASEIVAEHNNGIVIDEDGVMRGGIDNPVKTDAHASAYSELLDRRSDASSRMCGSCHDILIEDTALKLESTFVDWNESLYAKSELGAPLSCGACHMGESIGQAAQIEGAPERAIHRHNVPAIDVPLIDWPRRESMVDAVKGELFSVVAPEICVQQTPTGVEVKVTLENVAAGHPFPSGATHDRRAWVEVTGLDDEENILFQSGAFGPQEEVVQSQDPQLWKLFNEAYDSDGNITHDHWDSAELRGELLPAPATLNLAAPDYFDPHSSKTYFYPTAVGPTTVRIRVLIRPVGFDILHELVETGDLDASFLEEMQTFELGGTLFQWNAADNQRCNPNLR